MVSSTVGSSRWSPSDELLAIEVVGCKPLRFDGLRMLGFRISRFEGVGFQFTIRSSRLEASRRHHIQGALSGISQHACYLNICSPWACQNVSLELLFPLEAANPKIEPENQLGSYSSFIVFSNIPI